MTMADPYAFASMLAEQIIKGMEITALPINPMEIARNNRIEVVAKDMDDQGVSLSLIHI